MATVTLYLDVRRQRKDGTFPIKLRVTHRTSFLLSTGLSARQSEWKDNAFSQKAPNYKARNVQLRELLNKVERVLFDERALQLSPRALRARIEEVILARNAAEKTLLSYMALPREELSLSTKNLYKWTADKVREFDADVLVADVTDAWIDKFVTHLRGRGIVANSMLRILSRVKAAVQAAIEDGVLSRAPYKKIPVRQVATRKRHLTLEMMRALRDMPLTGRSAWARDMFFLSFYLIGINIADLYGLTELRDGRAEYCRRKTKRLYSIAVLPEAQAIIDKWGGTTSLLYWQGLRSHEVARAAVSHNLSKIMPGLTSYYARHTWGTFAAELDIPMETISHALGHEIGSPTTAIYIAFNQKKVDAANRAVIDYLNADLKARAEKK